MKEVEIVQVEGYSKGERVSMPDNRALVYVRNGQAKPLGWSPDETHSSPGPTNRMLDTGSEVATTGPVDLPPTSRRKKKAKKKASKDKEQSD